MDIDSERMRQLLLKANKKKFKKGLEYFSNFQVENRKDIFFHLTNITNLKDVDISFLLEFLVKRKYLKSEKTIYSLINRIHVEKCIDELTLFYLSTITEIETLSTVLFEKSEFSVSSDKICVDTSTVSLKYRQFFKVLQNLELLTSDSEKSTKVFIKNYSLAKKFLSRPLKKITPNELETQLELQRITGEKAEQFVFNYETTRLENKKSINWISKMFVNEGYDIESFNAVTNHFYNRFIEVKSFSGLKPYFFWSINEIETARIHGEKYWLYLVDSKRILEDRYSPIMICNPFETIIDNSSWEVSKESLKFTFVD